MGQNPQGGRSNAGGLPNVGPGDGIRASDINNLSKAVAAVRGGLANSGGISSTTTASGTTFHVTSNHKHHHPWMVTIKGEYMNVEPGCFFVDAPMAGGVSQIAASAANVMNGGRNGWHFMSSLPGAAPYDYKPPNGFYMGGAEVWIEDSTCNVLSTKQLYIGNDGIVIKVRQGLYYLDYSAWNGRQLEQMDNPSGDQQVAAFNQGIAVWNAYSTNMKGRLVPVLKYASGKSDSDATTNKVEYMFNIKRLVYPICTIDEYGTCCQGVQSDVFHYERSADVPFYVWLLQSSSGLKAAVNPGTVNGAIPKIAGQFMDAQPQPLLAISGVGRIYLKANSVARKFFPSDSEVVFIGGTTAPPDTTSAGYKLLASITQVGSQAVVTQLASGNQQVNRFKQGAQGAAWIWSA